MQLVRRWESEPDGCENFVSQMRRRRGADEEAGGRIGREVKCQGPDWGWRRGGGLSVSSSPIAERFILLVGTCL